MTVGFKCQIDSKGKGNEEVAQMQITVKVVDFVVIWVDLL